MRKRTMLVGIILAYVCIEIACMGLFVVLRGTPFASTVFDKKIVAIEMEPGVHITMDANGNHEYLLNEYIHPYIGYSVKEGNPDTSIGFGEVWPLEEIHNDNAVWIGIFGGSFARQFTEATRDALRTELESLPKFQGKNIIIATSALGGTKQPQQLMQLQYLSLLGVPFDMVINIDGFNESTLHFQNPPEMRESILYPRDWYSRIVHSTNQSQRTLMQGELTFLQHRRIVRAHHLRSLPFSYSGIIVIGFHLIDAIDRARIRDIRHNISTIEDHSVMQHTGQLGPTNKALQLPENTFDALAELWTRSSLHMQQLSASLGASYIHILQPNQYVAQSKPMSMQEQIIARDSSVYYAKYVPEVYPKFLSRSAELRKKGVQFIDATMVFSDTEQMLYSDKCCHLNQEGYRRFMPTVLEAIKDAVL